MENWSEDWTSRKTHTALKAVGIIVAYSAVIIGYLALAIWGRGGAP